MPVGSVDGRVAFKVVYGRDEGRAGWVRMVPHREWSRAMEEAEQYGTL